METDPPMTPEAQSQVLAKKALKQLKRRNWNIPDRVPLTPGREVVVGRCSEASVVMHSPKLPSMLSRKHAALRYSPDNKHWLVEDLKSVNGVCVNDMKIEAGTSTPLKIGDEICFGVNIDNNDFKYLLTLDHGTPLLKRRGGTEQRGTGVQRTKQRGSGMQKTEKRGSGMQKTEQRGTGVQRTEQRGSGMQKTEQRGSGMQKTEQRGSGIQRTEQRGSGVPKTEQRGTGVPKTEQRLGNKHHRTPSPTETSLPAKKHLRSDPTDGDEEDTTPQLSPVGREVSSKTSTPVKKAAAPCSQPLRLGSQFNIEDAIFPDEKDEDQDSLSQAIFGDMEVKGTTVRKLASDATTIRIQMAKAEMEKEKHKLLSSIEALKSELAAKEQLITEKEDREKARASTANNSMLSSMQEEFTCVICQELFINAYTLPCAHSFCELCIKVWMKKKRQKDCPICRKKITSDPVHSIVLDNAISKVVEKLGPDALDEREKLKQSHAEDLKALSAPSPAAASARVPSMPTARVPSMPTPGVTTRSRAPVVPTSPIMIHCDVPPPVITISDEEDDSEDSLTSHGSGSSGSDEDLSGAYYGGYGSCYRCGRRGHWAPGCPYY